MSIRSGRRQRDYEPLTLGRTTLEHEQIDQGALTGLLDGHASDSGRRAPIRRAPGTLVYLLMTSNAITSLSKKALVLSTILLCGLRMLLRL
jgi:hypothetical protein